ncbi:hypothetical protein [Streptomyces sp. NPDC058451]|uniref:hypothetical protein n=1 Tax=Streptomyces sp. NPDC058451 TaxID=3346506 RepID=UPI00364AEEE7
MQWGEVDVQLGVVCLGLDAELVRGLLAEPVDALGLMLLVIAHIAGGVHSASFAGPHLGVDIVAETHRSAAAPAGAGRIPGIITTPGITSITRSTGPQQAPIVLSRARAL